MEMMTLEINGELRKVPQLSSLRALLTHLGIGEDRIAVEVNRHIIRRKDWGITSLKDNDRIEIVQFVGGG